MELHISKILNGFFNNISRSQFETIMSQNQTCFRYTTPRRAKVEVTMDTALSAMLLTNASNIAGTIGFGMAFDYESFTEANGTPKQSLLSLIEQSTIDVKMLFLSIFDKAIKEKGRALKNLFGSLVNLYYFNDLDKTPFAKAVLETDDDKINYVLDGRDKISRRLVSVLTAAEVEISRVVTSNIWTIIVGRSLSNVAMLHNDASIVEVESTTTCADVSDDSVCPICGERLVRENRLNFFGEWLTVCINTNCSNSYGPLSMRFNSALKNRNLVEKVGVFDSKNILFQLKITVSRYSEDLCFLAVEDEVVANFVSRTEIITRPISLKKKAELLNVLTSNGVTIESVKVLKMTNVTTNDVTVIKSLIERGSLQAPQRTGRVIINIDTMEVTTISSNCNLNVDDSFNAMFVRINDTISVNENIDVPVSVFEGGAC